MIQEAYIQGDSTRKNKKLATSLGMESISASQFSLITKELNEQVEAFLNRSLEKVYPVLWVDALYEKIHDGHRVVNMAVQVVIGMNVQGKREILAVEPMLDESEATYKTLFEGLKTRGLQDAWLVVSDAHKGLAKAIRESFLGCCWKRCKVHMMRNILAHVPSRDKERFAARLKQIWLQPDYKAALSHAEHFMNTEEKQHASAIQTLEEGLEDTLQFFHFEKMDSRKISSTNLLERLNKEIRRRTRVVGVFPSQDSYNRLVTSYLTRYSEECSAGSSYIHPKIIEQDSRKTITRRINLFEELMLFANFI